MSRRISIGARAIAVTGVAVLLFPLADAFPAHATTQRGTTLEELARESDVIVRGTVIAVTVHPAGPRDRPGIHTEVQIAAEEFMAGAPVSVVTIWVQGGRLGNLWRRIPGQASFQAGEHVLALLFASDDGVLWPTGMARGKWRLDRAHGRLVATPTARLVDSSAARDASISLANLRVRVRAARAGE